MLASLSACASAPSQSTSPSTVGSAQPKDKAVSLERMDEGFLYLAAQDALEHGQKVLATRFLQALIKKDTQSVIPKQELATLLVSTGSPSEIENARVIVESVSSAQLSELAPEQLKEFLFVKAEVMVASGRLEYAYQELNALLQQYPDFTKARLLLVRLSALDNDVNKAIRLIDAGIALNGDEKLYQAKVQLYLQQGEQEKADKVLIQMQKKFSDSESVVLQRARLAESRSQFKKAEKILLRFIKGHDDDAYQTRQMLANFYVRRDRLEEALAIYEYILGMSGGDAEIYMSIGKVEYQLAQFEKAMSAFASAERNFAGESLPHASEYQSEAIFYLAASQEALHMPAEAIENYLKILPSSAYYFDAQLRLITISIVRKEEADAEQRISAVKAQFPHKIEIYELISRLRVQQKKYAILLKETEDALDIEFSRVVLFNRAVALEALERYEEMDETLELLIRQEPENPDALNFLGYSLAERSIRLSEAEAMISKALKIKPDDGYFLDSLAWVYFKQKKYGQAIDVQLKALKAVENDPVMQEHLGDMYWKNGDSEQAKERWRRSIEMGHESPALIKKKIQQGL